MNHSKYLKIELDKLGLKHQGKVVKVYADGETPSANNPDCFISISNNGNAQTRSSQYGLIEQSLLVGIYVKLSSTGIKNTTAEDVIFNMIFNKFKSTVASAEYTFTLSKLNLFGSYKNLTAGYSTRMVNLDSSYKN